MAVQFKDNRIAVKAAINKASLNFLEEAAGLVEESAIDNTPIDTGQLKGAWAHRVDSTKGEAVIGNPLEYSIWVEYGTGEYALEGNGRKGGWVYVDDKGKGHFTYGRRPVRMLHNAFVTNKAAIVDRAKQLFGGIK